MCVRDMRAIADRDLADCQIGPMAQKSRRPGYDLVTYGAM